MQKINLDLAYWNKKLKNKSPDQIIDWALKLSNNNIVTTSFGMYSSVLLSTMSRHEKSIKVNWCDTLYNLPSTYKHANYLISKYKLNIYTYKSLKSREEIEQTIGLPKLSDTNFDKFSEVVKLEPFRLAMKEHNPDIWFTNIRVRQTEYRDKKDILSYSNQGVLKVSPFYYWSDNDLDNYLEVHQLPKNKNYFDPIKALHNRECGIHFQ